MIPLEPEVGWQDLASVPRSWDSIDDSVRAAGIDGLAIPSVRWGLDLVLRKLNCFRYRDAIVAPQFLSRCIVNTLTRTVRVHDSGTDAHPKAVLLVHQFGFRHDVTATAHRYGGAAIIEDVPAGIPSWPFDPEVSVCRLSAVSKCMPVVWGAILESRDEEILSAARRQRVGDSWAGWWSWWVTARSRMKPGSVSPASVNAANEMYPDVGGGCALLRMNFGLALSRLDEARRAFRRRAELAREVLGDSVLSPDGVDPGQVLLVKANDPARLAKVLQERGVATGVYHYDAAKGVGDARWERVVPIPAATVEINEFRRLLSAAASA